MKERKCSCQVKGCKYCAYRNSYELNREKVLARNLARGHRMVLIQQKKKAKFDELTNAFLEKKMDFDAYFSKLYEDDKLYGADV